MRVLAAGCVLALLAGSCRSGPPAETPEELRAGIAAVATLDPLAVSAGEGTGDEELVLRQVTEGLVAYDRETLEPRPALAGSWTVSADSQTYTFELREGVRFHSGELLTARDAAAAFHRLAWTPCVAPASPVAGAPASLLAPIEGYEDTAVACRERELAGVRATGTHTLEVRLAEPWAGFPAALGHPALAVLPADAEPEELERAPDGTGAYRVAETWDGTSLRLERFDDYWGDTGEIEAVTLAGYADPGRAYVDLLQDELHQVVVPAERARHARRALGAQGFVRTAAMSGFGFNLASERVSSPGFRYALSIAVDRESIASAIFQGTREPATGLVPPVLPGAAEDACGALCTFLPEEAARRIADLYPDGPPRVRIGVPDGGSHPAVGNAVAEMLREVGVEARVVERPLAEHLQGVRDGDVDLFQLGWMPPYPAPGGVLRPLFHSDAADNHMGYGSSDVDDLLDRARRTGDTRDRWRLFRETEEEILLSLPFMPLLWGGSTLAFDRRLQPTDGVLVDALGHVVYAETRFGEER